MTEPCDPTGHPWQTYCSVHDSWRIVGADCWVARAEKAEATIQRVREVLERYRTSPYSEMSQTDALGAVGRALDGDSDA